MYKHDIYINTRFYTDDVHMQFYADNLSYQITIINNVQFYKDTLDNYPCVFMLSKVSRLR